MDWSTWKPASCLPECWCEAARVGQFVLEPVNAWTNLLFMGAGLYFILNAKKFMAGTNQLNSNILFPRTYGFALFFVGAGSFFFHASQTFVGQWFDVFGMYLVSMFYICYNFYRTSKMSIQKFLFYYLGSCIVLGIIILYFPMTRRYLFGMSIAFALFQSLWINKKFKPQMENIYLWSSLACYLVAQSVWLLDKKKIWCNPHAVMNGHGIWHLLTACAAILVYMFFYSEKKRPA
jgi:magnesium-transporting ATPase (P-type)